MKIQNPRYTNHELIVDTGANTLTPSDDVNPNTLS
jgi:hypothetical protein